MIRPQHRMYIRPETLYHKFEILKSVETVNTMGRPITEYKPTDDFLIAALGEATPEQRYRWEQLQHPITHTIVCYRVQPKAKPGDMLKLGPRTFLVAGVDEPGDIQVCTLYYVEERSDVK